MYIFICINLYFVEFCPDWETFSQTQHVELKLNRSLTLLYSCLFFFSFCLPEQSNDHRCREGETAGENFMSTFTRSPLLFCCPVKKKKTKHRNPKDKNIIGVCIPRCKRLPYVFISRCWRLREPEWWLNEASVNLYQSISLLLCLTEDTRGNSRPSFFFFPSDYQAGKLSGSHRQRCKWMLVIQKRH